LALFGIGGFAAETKALPVFYAVVEYENALVPAAPQVLYEVEFASSGVQEIGEIGIEATAFTAEPGTGRLLAWVDQFGSGLYEIDSHTGASSLLGAAPSGTGIDELFFTPSGALHALSSDPSVLLQGPTYEIDLATAALTPLGSDPFAAAFGIDALTYAPNGDFYLTVGSQSFWNETGVAYYDLRLEEGPAQALATDATTLFMLGVRVYEEPVVIGSTSFLSGAQVRSRRLLHLPPPPAGSAPCFGPAFDVLPSAKRIIGLARVPEPASGLLLLSGFVFFARYRRSPRERHKRASG